MSKDADPVRIGPRTFTLAEASRILPKLTSILQQLQGLHRSLEQNGVQMTNITEQLTQDATASRENLNGRLRVLTAQQVELAETFEARLNELERQGCLLKDIEMGLVDFYSVRNGELIFLCWKLDEPSISHWHPLNGGFAARRPLD